MDDATQIPAEKLTAEQIQSMKTMDQAPESRYVRGESDLVSPPDEAEKATPDAQ
jgi:hypothetical protein